jgi:integrase
LEQQQQLVSEFNRVNTFLNSIGRNSKNSRRTYATGLKYFERFLNNNYPNQDPDTIIKPLQDQRINVYELLDQLVAYLSQQNISIPSLKLYMTAVRSFLEYNDIDISVSKFKRKVKMPRFYPDQEEPLSLSDIRELLEYCSNTRLRCYLLVLVSSGLRAMEAASLRLKDVDFTVSPTRINIRKEITKTKRGRVVYCSDETTKHLQKLLQFRKNDMQPETLIFSIQKRGKSAETIYFKMLHQFEKLQKIANKDQRKENSKRHKITFHSFRRTCFSIINESTNSEYANWFLGHNHSVYWTHKESERREIYRTKCMPFLTIYQETRDNSLESAAQEKERMIKLITNRLAEKDQHIEALEYDNRLIKDLYQDVAELKKKLES